MSDLKMLPYRAVTATGDTYDFEFPLHKDTVDAVRVSQMISSILHAIDHDMAVCGETSNGDVLQALAMVLAIRSRMIHAPDEKIRSMVQVLIEFSLDAGAAAGQNSPPTGHA